MEAFDLEMDLETLGGIVRRNKDNKTFIFGLKKLLLVLRQLDREISYVVFPRAPTGAISTGSVFIWIQSVLHRLWEAQFESIPWSTELDNYRTDTTEQSEQAADNDLIDLDNSRISNSSHVSQNSVLVMIIIIIIM